MAPFLHSYGSHIVFMQYLLRNRLSHLHGRFSNYLKNVKLSKDKDEREILTFSANR